MTQSLSRLSSGVVGLDEILYVGLHFLAVGAALGEKTLFISLEESEERLRHDAEKRGINIEKVEILDISPGSDFFHGSAELRYFLICRSGT